MCSAADAFRAAHQGTLGSAPYTHVVMTLGGNDFMPAANCSMTKATLQARVTRAIETVIAA